MCGAALLVAGKRHPKAARKAAAAAAAADPRVAAALGVKLRAAVHRGGLGEVEAQLKAGAPVDECDGDGTSPLNIAATRGYVAVLEKLLKSGADVRLADQRGWTALHRAASTGRVECVVRLLKHKTKADPNTPDKAGWTPLHWAQTVPVAELLLASGAEDTAKNKKGETPEKLTSKAGSAASRTEEGRALAAFYVTRREEKNKTKKLWE